MVIADVINKEKFPQYLLQFYEINMNTNTNTNTNKNIITLLSARDQLDRRRCGHSVIIVDEYKSEVECESCGEKLNPIAILLRIASEESIWKVKIQGIKAMEKRLEERRRVKCEFCHKLTKIRN